MRSSGLGNRSASTLKAAVAEAVRPSSPSRLAAALFAGGLVLTGLGTAGGLHAETLAPVAPAENSPREALRQKLFGAGAAKAACQVIPAVKAEQIAAVDLGLASLVATLVKGLNTADDKSLLPLFHPRMNVGLPALASTIAKLEHLIGRPFDASVFRLFAMNTVDGHPGGLACDGEQVTIWPLYGYPLQFGLWLQIAGAREIGRLYAVLVPVDGRWLIGALTTQQWTHDSKDEAAWAEQAAKAAAAGQKMAAFALYDVAAKLVGGGNYMQLARTQALSKARDQLFPAADWEREIRRLLKDEDLAYVATMLVSGGAGVFLRPRVPVELSVEAQKRRCEVMATTLAREPWTKDLAGVRCAFLLPKEDPRQDGLQGALYLPFAELKSAANR